MSDVTLRSGSPPEGRNGSLTRTNGIGLEEALEQERHRLKVSKPLRIGFPKTERMLRLSTGKYVVLAGRPGCFKTTVTWNWACNLALAGKKVLWVGLEMGAGQMANMLLSRLSGISRDDLEADAQGVRLLNDAQQERLAKVQADAPSTLVFHQNSARLGDILESANMADYEAVFLDYAQLVQSGPQKEYDRVSLTSQSLARHAHERNRLVVALSQMNREIEKVPGTGSKSRMPTLADLRGSGQLEQDADAVLFLHPKSYTGEWDRKSVTGIIQKNRFGPGGFIEYVANPEIGHVEEEPETPEEVAEAGGTPSPPPPSFVNYMDVGESNEP